jgi:molybdenum cofactor biosynthesis enzyme MoaA
MRHGTGTGNALSDSGWEEKKGGSVTERANYVTCPKGHKVYVIWSSELNCFGFTCDECRLSAQRVVSPYGVMEIKIAERAK